MVNRAVFRSAVNCQSDCFLNDKEGANKSAKPDKGFVNDLLALSGILKYWGWEKRKSQTHTHAHTHTNRVAVSPLDQASQSQGPLTQLLAQGLQVY